MRLVALGMCAVLACSAFGQAGPRAAAAADAVGWDEAFADRSADRPVHFVASYADGGGQKHRLEEWRVGLAHVRRRTDERIDLHADALAVPVAGRPVDYLWQVLDLEKKIDHRLTSGAMLRAGMLYSYYSMAHVLTRPAGMFTVTRMAEVAPLVVGGVSCEWFEILPTGQAGTRVCWAREVGIPLRTLVWKDGGWHADFTVQTIDRKAIAPGVFAVDTGGFQVRNVGDLAEDD